MCFGPPEQPKTEKAATFRTVIQVIMVVQIIIVILNFVAASAFARQGIFGIFFIFLLFLIQRRLSYQIIMIFIFISIFFAVNFMVAFLTPIQNQTKFADLSGMKKFIYADAVISFVYYTFCAIFFFYPYREFKKIEYGQNPALAAYFSGGNDNQGGRQNRDTKNEDADYNIDYGNIKVDQKKRNNDNGTFEVFKGQGVRIG